MFTAEGSARRGAARGREVTDRHYHRYTSRDVMLCGTGRGPLSATRHVARGPDTADPARVCCDETTSADGHAAELFTGVAPGDLLA